MNNTRPSFHNRTDVIPVAQMPTTLDTLCAGPLLFRGEKMPDQDFMIEAYDIERDDETGRVLEAGVNLINLEVFEGPKFRIAERARGGHVALLPDTPCVIITSMVEFFESLTQKYAADLKEGTIPVLRMSENHRHRARR